MEILPQHNISSHRQYELPPSMHLPADGIISCMSMTKLTQTVHISMHEELSVASVNPFCDSMNHSPKVYLVSSGNSTNINFPLTQHLPNVHNINCPVKSPSIQDPLNVEVQTLLGGY